LLAQDVERLGLDLDYLLGRRDMAAQRRLLHCGGDDVRRHRRRNGVRNSWGRDLRLLHATWRLVARVANAILDCSAPSVIVLAGKHLSSGLDAA
jgi:hypothetical protein